MTCASGRMNDHFKKVFGTDCEGCTAFLMFQIVKIKHGLFQLKAYVWQLLEH